MRIAFLTTQVNLKTGGGSNLSPHLKATSMALLGHQVSMFTFFPEKNSFFEKTAYSLIESPTRFKNWMALQIKIFFLLRKHQNDFDIFVFEGEHFIWGAGLYRTLGGKTPVLLHFNGPVFSIYEHGTTYAAGHEVQKSLRTKISDGWRIFFEKNIGVHFANHIDAFTISSPIMKDWMSDFGLNRDKIVVLSDFDDLEIFFKKSELVCSFDKSKTNIIYVGRLAPEKGVDTLLKALSEMENRKNIVVHIVGDGREKERLIKMSQEYKLEDSVVFYGWIDKQRLNGLYHDSDFFVHPARWAEPLGLTIPEAMATGLPVIVPEVSGSAWAAGEAGITFKNGDYKDLKDKLKKMIDDKGLREGLAGHAEKEARRFEYRNSIKPLENLLKKITS
ncbi:MAG: glycosyltransferase family 4 protein [bacterium]|nr:glycosyltransferase family 4 protein [bacterium]